MPPKAKPPKPNKNENKNKIKNKNKNKKMERKFIGEIEITKMTRDELENIAKNLKENLMEARSKRNAVQMKRDKMRQIWASVEQETDELKAELEVKIKEIGVTEEEADTEMKHLRQEMKYWEFELPSKILKLKTEETTQLKLSQSDFDAAKEALLKEKHELRQKLHAAELFREQEMTALNKLYEEKYNAADNDTEDDLDDIDEKYKNDLIEQKQKLDLMERVRLFSYNEERNAHMVASRKLHNDAYDELKGFYMDITHNSLALIHALQKQIRLSQRDTIDFKYRGKVAHDAILPLLEPLKLVKNQVVYFRFKIERHKEFIKQLANSKDRNEECERRIKGLLFESDVLLASNEKLHLEMEALENCADDIIANMQQIAGINTLELEKKVKQLEGHNKTLLAQIDEIRAAVCVPALRDKLEGVEEIVDREVNKQTHNLNEMRYKLARACKAHDDLIEYYECKCKELGLPADQLGFELLRNSAKIAYLKAPAGLLSKNT